MSKSSRSSGPSSISLAPEAFASSPPDCFKDSRDSGGALCLRCHATVEPLHDCTHAHGRAHRTYLLWFAPEERAVCVVIIRCPRRHDTCPTDLMIAICTVCCAAKREAAAASADLRLVHCACMRRDLLAHAVALLGVRLPPASAIQDATAALSAIHVAWDPLRVVSCATPFSACALHAVPKQR